MQQTMINRKTKKRPLLRAVKVDPSMRTRMSHLVNTAWNFAYSSLWNCNQFSTKEITASKEKIEEYLRAAANPEKAFRAFCERVLLARYSLLKKVDSGITLPSVWLDKNNASGFGGTKPLYDEIKGVRESIPAYKAELRALAEAALEFSEEPTTQNYHYWRQYFIDRDTPGLLSLFQMIAVQQIANA